MILLIDNYDSFSYNVYQLAGQICPDIRVIRNDEMTVEQIRELAPSHIILSPGPGRPSDAGVCKEVIQELGNTTPILGICLGHQAIYEVFGGVVTYAPQLMHGKASVMTLDTDSVLFSGLPKRTEGARYHSLIGEKDTLPDCLRVTAETDAGEIMAVEHRDYPIYGIQFHPESILTWDGAAMMKNFLKKGIDERKNE